jgi:hypothetical protein
MRSELLRDVVEAHRAMLNQAQAAPVSVPHAHKLGEMLHPDDVMRPGW